MRVVVSMMLSVWCCYGASVAEDGLEEATQKSNVCRRVLRSLCWKKNVHITEAEQLCAQDESTVNARKRCSFLDRACDWLGNTTVAERVKAGVFFCVILGCVVAFIVATSVGGAANGQAYSSTLMPRLEP